MINSSALSGLSYAIMPEISDQPSNPLQHKEIRCPAFQLIGHCAGILEIFDVYY